MIPKIIHEDLSHSGWCIAMLEEMNTLDDNGTCDFISLPTGKKTFGCKWVFAIKVNPGGSIAHLKVHLVVKGYAQTYGIDHFDKFSPVAKLTYVRLFISMAASQACPLH